MKIRLIAALVLLVVTTAIAAPYTLWIDGAFNADNQEQAPDRIRIWVYYPNGQELITDSVITAAGRFGFARPVDSCGTYSGFVSYIHDGDSVTFPERWNTTLTDTGAVRSAIWDAGVRSLTQEFTATIDWDLLEQHVAAAIPDLTAHLDSIQTIKWIALATWNYLLADAGEGVPEAYRTVYNGAGYGDRAYDVIIHLRDSTNNDAPVPFTPIEVQNLSGTILVPPRATNANGNTFVSLDTGLYRVYPRTAAFSFPQSSYRIHVTGNQADSINCASRIILQPETPGMCEVNGYLRGAAGEVCASCDVVLELINATGNCIDTSGHFAVMDKTVRASTDDAGYLTKQVLRTDNIVCEKSGDQTSAPKWRMTVYRENRRWGTLEFTFYTDTTTVDIGRLLR